MEANIPGRVVVRFREEGTTVSYAQNLAEMLNVPLLAYTPIDHAVVAQRAQITQVEQAFLRSTMHVRMQGHLSTGVGRRGQHTEIGIPHAAQGDIIVTCAREYHFPCALQLSPAGERNVFRTDVRELFVPIGDGPSALRGAQIAIMLAHLLRARICLWHTTWRNEHIASEKPIDHALPHVRTTLLSVSAYAQHMQVPTETVVECAPRLVEGLVTTALRRGSGLIVMALGTHKHFGTYTMQVRERNCPIPLLITGADSQ